MHYKFTMPALHWMQYIALHWINYLSLYDLVKYQAPYNKSCLHYIMRYARLWLNSKLTSFRLLPVTMDLLNEVPVTLVVKAPNQKVADQTVECALNWTVRKLKEHLARVYPSNPVSLRKRIMHSSTLIYYAAGTSRLHVHVSRQFMEFLLCNSQCCTHLGNWLPFKFNRKHI